jgi:hypothetical protein
MTLALIASLALPAAAAGQFGNIIKKGKDKAAKEAAKAVCVEPAQPASGTLKFDNTILELTTPVVNQVIAGLKVRAAGKDAQGRNSAELRCPVRVQQQVERSPELPRRDTARQEGQGDGRREEQNAGRPTQPGVHHRIFAPLGRDGQSDRRPGHREGTEDQ